MSNYIMQVDIFGNDVRCETDGLLVSLTDLHRAGNKWRAENARSLIHLPNITGSVGFTEFKTVAQADMPGQVLFRVDGKGNAKRTMAHVILAVYVAEQFSPEFHYKVIKTFVEGKLLDFRDQGGTEFKSLNAAIDNAMMVWEGGVAHKGHFIQAAKLMNQNIRGEDEALLDWSKATVAQTHKRYELEATLVKFLGAGVVRDWEHLKELIGKL